MLKNGKMGNPMVECINCGENDCYTIDSMHNGTKVVGIITYCDNCGESHGYMLKTIEPLTFHALYDEMWMQSPTMGKMELKWDDTCDMWTYVT